jgi:GTP-binding protein HflX
LADLKRTELSVKQERAVLVGVILPDSTADPRDPLGELNSLARTAGARVIGQIIQKRSRPDTGTYIGSGKAAQIAQLAKKEKADVVVFDNDLSPGQIGALEKIINEEAGSNRNDRGIKVLDRSELILDIFATRAQTHEAKLQVELAQMQYTYPRLAKMWGHFGRAAGTGAGVGIGSRGPVKRSSRSTGASSASASATSRARSSTSRSARPGSSPSATSNTSPSASSATPTPARARCSTRSPPPAPTPTTSSSPHSTPRPAPGARARHRGAAQRHGRLRPRPAAQPGRQLQGHARGAVHADLLLHVLDVGHPHAEQQFESVHTVLEEIGAKGKPEILLLNKIDTEEGEANFPTWRTLHPDAIPVSARTGLGLDRSRKPSTKPSAASSSTSRSRPTSPTAA